jgi:hypothetical protein
LTAGGGRVGGIGMMKWFTVALLAAVLLAGCVPQVVVTQPHLLLHIQNEAGEAIPAQVTLYWWEYPHRRQRGVTVVPADGHGTAAFTETVAAEVLMPLVPHGVPAYNWSFCVAVPTYKTVIGTVSSVEPGATVQITLPLHPGETHPVCEDYARLSNHPGTRRAEVEFSGADVHGVYEVDAVAR